MEETKRDRKKEKQKTDETRNNLGKAWVAYKGVCAGSLQEFVNHLLAVHELYCHNSRDRRKAQMAEEGEELEEGETTEPTHSHSPKNRNSRPDRDEHSSAGSPTEDYPPRDQRRVERPRSEASAHSEASHMARRTRTVVKRSPEPPKSLSRSRSRSLSRTRQQTRGRGMQEEEDPEMSEEEEMYDDRNARPSGSGGNLIRDPLGVSVTGLPMRSSDTSLKDGLYHKFKKYGKISSVNVTGEGEDRSAVISFKKTEDVSQALDDPDSRTFFGSQIMLSAHEGFASPDENDYAESDCSEYHVKATRTLYVRNLEDEIRIPDLREIFKPFGEILDIDIKRQNEMKYAFIQYTDISSVVRARREMEDKMIGEHRIKTGFGKSLPTKCVWLDNLDEKVTEKFLCQQFSRYGPVCNSTVDCFRGKALVYFEGVDHAQYAVNEMRNRILFSKKIMIDFASAICEQAFYQDLERSAAMGSHVGRPSGRGSRGRSGFFVSGGSREGYGNPGRGRPQGRNTSDWQHGYNNQGQGGPQGRSRSNSDNYSGGGGRIGRGTGIRGTGNRQQGFHERSYSQESDQRERRYYDDYGPEPPMHRDRDDSFEGPSYTYRKQERSLSPPRKRRTLMGEPRNSRPQTVVREVEGRYSKQYQERYPNPPPRDQYEDTYSGHMDDSGDESVGPRQPSRPMRSFHNEPVREYRAPIYDDKNEPRAAFSPAQSSSDFTHHSPSPERDDL